MAILKSAGMVMQLPSSGGGRGGRAGDAAAPAGGAASNAQRQVAELTELLEQARHYAKAREANPQTARDRQLDALVPVVQGKTTVFLQAQTARDIRSAIEFAKDGSLLVGVTYGDTRNSVYRSIDGGQTWQAASHGLRVPWRNHMVERFSHVDDELWAVLSNGEVIAAPLASLEWQELYCR